MIMLEQKEQVPYILRSHTKYDEPFIYDTFNRVFREMSPNNFIPHNIFFQSHSAIIGKILQRSKCLIACDTQDPDYIFGYILYDLITTSSNKQILILHWMHIKAPYRHNGFAREILTSIYPGTKTDAIICSHNNRMFKQCKDRYHLQYDPYEAI